MIESPIWRAAQSLTASGVVCSLLLGIGLIEKAPRVALNTVVVLLACLIGQAMLWIYRKKKPQLLAAWIYLGIILLALSIVSLNHELFVQTKIAFIPFIGVKILAIIIALQTPIVRWVGWTCLACLMIVPTIQFYSWPLELRETIGHLEPWLTTAIVTCSGFIYLHRLQIFEILEKKARLEASATELRRFTHLLLSAQHLVNTPLQVIEGTTQLIRDQHPDTLPLVQKIEKAFIPIQHISQLMAFGNDHICWDQLALPTSVEELEKQVHLLAEELAENQTQFHLRTSPDPRPETRVRI